MENYTFEFLLIIFSLILLSPSAHSVRLSPNFNKQDESPIAKNYLILTSLFLGLMIILRDETIGNDTIEYLRSFNRHIIWDFDNRFEPGYNVIQSATKVFSNNPFAILVPCGIITSFLFYDFIRRYSKYYFLSILLFVFLGFWGQCMNIIRQTVACALIAYSYRYLISKKNFRFFITVIIASTFHSTAIVFAIAWFIKSIRLTTINLLYALIGVGLIYLSFSTVLNSILMIDDSYENYTNSIFGEGNRIGALFQASCFIGLLIGALIIRMQVGSSIFRYYGLDMPFIFCFIGASIVLLSYNMSIFGRIAQYFNIFQLILLPNAVRLLKINRQYVATICIFIYVNIFFWVTQILRPEWNQIFPYKTYL